MVAGIGVVAFVISLLVSYQAMPDDSGLGRFLFTAVVTTIVTVVAHFVVKDNRETRERAEREKENLDARESSNQLRRDAAGDTAAARSTQSPLPTKQTAQGPDSGLSAQAQRATNDAFRFIDQFEAALETSGANADLEDRLERLTPEARMLAWEMLIQLTGEGLSEQERSRQMVGHVMRGGKATLGELQRDLESMSAEGRARALASLVSSPEYTVSGIRWDPPFSGVATAKVSSYQSVIDMLRVNVDPRWAEAMNIVHGSKTEAGDGNWAGAATSIRRAVKILEDLAVNVSPIYRNDLAVAFYHLEAYLGNAGDRAGAQVAITKSLALLTALVRTDGRESVRFDLAKAMGSQATIFAEEGNFADAMKGQAASIALLENLADSDLSAFGPALAEHLAQQAVFQRHAGLPYEARGAIEAAMAQYSRLAASGVRIAPEFVEHARGVQATIQSIVTR